MSNNDKIRAAAKHLYDLINEGVEYGKAELNVIIGHKLEEEEVPRLQECYATEFAIDDG